MASNNNVLALMTQLRETQEKLRLSETRNHTLTETNTSLLQQQPFTTPHGSPSSANRALKTSPSGSFGRGGTSTSKSSASGFSPQQPQFRQQQKQQQMHQPNFSDVDDAPTMHYESSKQQVNRQTRHALPNSTEHNNNVDNTADASSDQGIVRELTTRVSELTRRNTQLEQQLMELQTVMKKQYEAHIESLEYELRRAKLMAATASGSSLAAGHNHDLAPRERRASAAAAAATTRRGGSPSSSPIAAKPYRSVGRDGVSVVRGNVGRTSDSRKNLL